VAASLGQRSDQSFFRMQAQVQMEFAFQVLALSGLAVTLENAYGLLTSDTVLKDVMQMLEKQQSPAAKMLLEHYEGAFRSQPAEQLGGVKTTVANYLKYFTDFGIAEVFCSAKSSFSFDELDRGKVVCVSLPQRYQVERRYINTLLKLSFYAHALRRFDKPAAARAADNLLILWADEAQKIVTASDDGMSDYNVVDVIREARATVVAATQSYQSLIPPMGDERKAKVFIANMANRVTFCAADEDSAKIAADTLGKRKSRRRTYGWSAGKRTTSWTEEDKYWFEPHQLRKLPKFHAVVQYCSGGFRKVVLPPLGADGKIPAWYRQ
jgi:type IV secretory pathway TraG/TraD family ATPase VirD4